MTVTSPRAAFILALALLGGSAAAAQTPPRIAPRGPAQPAPVADPRVRISEEDARQTRERLRELLRQYPPSLGQVLSLDSSLLSEPAYLAPYPALATFLAEHPEVARTPSFFVGEWPFNNQENAPARDRVRAIENTIAAFFVLVGLMTLMGVVGWVAKMMIDHRRGLRISKAQTDMHAKILDRLTSNEDLLAYIQTPAGRRFLEGAPASIDAGLRAIGAPVGRILWSIQAGAVLTLVGLGVLFLSSRTAANPAVSDAAPFLFMIGTVIAATGAGFLVSAALAYAVSRHLGLFEAPTSSHA